MGWKKFTIRFILIYTLSYTVFGVLYFALITGEYYEKGGAFSAFLVSSSNTEAWQNVQLALVPVQIIRSILLVVVLLPIMNYIVGLSFSKKFFFLWGYTGIAAGFASDLPAPGNLEGMLYFSEVITWKIHAEILSEIIIQSGVFSFIFSNWIRK